MFYFLIKVII